MPIPQASEDFYSTIQQYELLLVAAGQRLWSQMTPEFDLSWARILQRLVAFVSGAQLAAATAGVGYVPAVLEETGQPNRPLADIRPQAFMGRASDGRDLVGLLDGAVVTTKQRVERGAAVDEALVGGRAWLEQALQTAVADAARDATAASIAVRQNLGWVRMVNPPCCRDCAVLAGAWYRWNDGFERHPNCDCVHIPSLESGADDFRTDPAKLVERGLITDLTKAQRRRIEEGADATKVLNESRDRWRVRMAADRRAAGPVDRLGRSRPAGWAGGGSNPPPPGTTIHQLFDKLTADVDRARVAREMRAAGIAD